MDNSLSESARFAVYREKLKGICEANNLSYVFIKNAYPGKMSLILLISPGRPNRWKKLMPRNWTMRRNPQPMN